MTGTSEARIGRRRWLIGSLLGVGVLINYFDRLNLSVAGPDIVHEFGLSTNDLGVLLSCFFWPYALLQVPAGLLLDRFGTLKVGRIGSLLWTISSLITGLSAGFGGLVAGRMLLGIAETPGFMVSSKATGYWFPRTERAVATALFDAAAKFSNVIGVPLVALAVVHYGWRFGFYITGALSFLYFLAFTVIYRDPSADRKLSERERAYIRSGGAADEGMATTGAAGILGYLLTQRKVWGLAVGFGAYGFSFYLFLTWLPGYLVTSMHMTLIKSASFAAIPWLVATVTDLLIGGWLIDFLIERGYDESRVRKSVLVTGMLFGLAVFGATQTTDPEWAITWISIALGGLAAAAPVGWSLPSLIAPKGGVGTVGGIMNFSNNMMGAAAPIVAAQIYTATHSFADAFMAAGIILVVGILSFIFLLGKIEQLPGPGH